MKKWWKQRKVKGDKYNVCTVCDIKKYYTEFKKTETPVKIAIIEYKGRFYAFDTTWRNKRCYDCVKKASCDTQFARNYTREYTKNGKHVNMSNPDHSRCGELKRERKKKVEYIKKFRQDGYSLKKATSMAIAKIWKNIGVPDPNLKRKNGNISHWEWEALNFIEIPDDRSHRNNKKYDKCCDGLNRSPSITKKCSICKKTRKYKIPDGLMETSQNNIVFEMNGGWTHCDPENNNKFTDGRKPRSEKWKEDKDKRKFYEDNGLDWAEIWERDWSNFKNGHEDKLIIYSNADPELIRSAIPKKIKLKIIVGNKVENYLYDKNSNI